MRVAFDTNAWVSFAIGKRLTALAALLKRTDVEVLRCPQLEAELLDVVNRPKMARFINSERRELVIRLLLQSTQSCLLVPPFARFSRDPKDDYLLALAQQARLDYLVTGDKDLLVLGTHLQTEILTFTDFTSRL